MVRQDTNGDIAAPARHVYGPRPLAALLPAITRPGFRRRSPAAAHVMIDWPAIVGPTLVASAEPRRLAGGTLTLVCTGAVAMELQHLAPELISRINTHLGATVVQRLRFVQGNGPVTPTPEHKTLPISDATAQAAEAAVGGLPEGPLREALAALGRLVLAGAVRSTPGSESS